MEHLAWVSAIILDTALKATVLLALAWAGGWMLKNRSAAARHMVRAFVLAALLLLPFSALLPGWHVPGIPEFLSRLMPAPPAVQPQIASSTWVGSTWVDPKKDMQAPVAVIRPKAAQGEEERSAVARPGPRVSQSTPASRQPVVIATAQKPESTTKPASKTNWLNLLAGAWLLGSAFFLLRWTISVVRLARLVRRAVLVTDQEWNERAQLVVRALQVRRRVALLVSKDTDVPLASGVLHPAVILPPDHGEWSEVRRNAILQHEMAHIKRLDALTQTVAQAATALYWFHPLAWLMGRAMRAERERACDDHVLAAGTKPSDYAHELLDIVSHLRQPELAAALAMARRSQLEGRVLAVLNPALRRGSVSRRAVFAAAALVLGVALPIAAMRPAQQASTPGAAASQSNSGPASAPAVAAPHPGQPVAIADAGSEAAYASALPLTQTMEAPEALQAEVSKLDELRGRLDELAARLEGERGHELERLLREETPALRDLQARLAQVDRSLQGSDLGEIQERVALLREQTRDMLNGEWPPAAPAAPSAPAAPAAPAAPLGDLKVCANGAKLHHMNMESHDNGSYKRWTATWSGDDCSVDLRAEGEIQFNADATDIQSISSGGYFEVNVREGATLRQVRATPSGSGVQYVFKINGQQQPFEGEAKTWFSNFLLALERTTGFAADTRVPRLLAKGGPSAVLDEINNLQGDYVRGIYFRKLLDQPNLPAPIVVRIINQAGSQIGSDYEMARVLMEVSKQYELPDETSRAAFLNAAGKLKSDYEHSRVLIELLKRPNISADNVRMALNSAAGIKSDYEKSRILLSLLDQKSFDQRNLDFYLKMVASINSDYEKSRDLIAPMQRYNLAVDQVNQIMDATAKISSDYEKSRLLTGLAAKGKFDEGQMGNYLKVVASMKSDYERSRSLLALMQSNTLSPASVSKALQAISQAGSDYEKSRVLTTLIAYKFDENQITNYLSVVDSMSSDFERSRCLIALLEHNKLGDAALGKVLDAVPRIKSDYEKSRVLQDVAGKYSPLQGALRESYIKAAESISSEYERNRVLAAVVRRASI